jgi:hypothetical protein
MLESELTGAAYTHICALLDERDCVVTRIGSTGMPRDSHQEEHKGSGGRVESIAMMLLSGATATDL